MEIKIETASIRLLDKFSEIENQCFDQEAFTKRQLAYLLTDYNSIGLVAKTDNAVAGFIISQVEIENDTTYGHIITINVVPSCRRKGVGTQMLKEMEKILKEKGINECHLEVREDNHAGLKLYLTSGYQKVAVLEKYYGSKHGLFLKKTL
ncbi:MAG TPA: ribosomal protein S18-alanine N-acetyltransferase [Candidatus Bathyarchaeia archaeon]|nr:ribosomal protein S18-alanine N-acetyltransferase [Candidatus Bathyarchaeia archaeon]